MPNEPAAWATSGAAWLSGDAGGPPLAPAGTLASRLAEVAGDLVADPMALLGERAALSSRLRRAGQVSCGGVTRLLPAEDGWVAICLARPDDIASVPALVEEVGDDPWDAVGRWVALRSTEEVVERTALLGLAASALAEARRPTEPCDRTPIRPSTPRSVAQPLVVDLSSLWAGPLCTNLLAANGARVVKVESRGRPDGARRGARRFFALLHAGTEAVALDFGGRRGHGRLLALLDRADVVVLAARRRAYRQLGIDEEAVVRSRSDKVVVLLTAHGWESNRIGFGDDVAVAGGLVAWDPVDGRPRFAADAIADPLTGVVAARAVTDCLAAGGQWYVDVPMSQVAAWFAGRAEPAIAADRAGRGWTLGGEPVLRPRARPVPGPAPRLGADSRRVLREIGWD